MNTAADSEHVVLIVDDEEMIVRLLCHQLANVPATVVPTSSPAEAIHILQTREVAVLLCDLNMPRIEGPAVLAVAREEQPNIVSIVVTGGADPSATMKAINDGGIWKYIAKPWQQEELVALVCEALEHYNNLLHQQKQLEKLARQIKADTQKVAEESGRRQVRISKKTGKSLKKTAPEKTPSESKTPSTIQKKQIRIRKTQHGEEKAPKDEPSTTCKKKQIRIVKKGSAAPETPEQDPHQADRDLFAESRYILGDYLGCGPFGCVYEAEDKLLNQPVAIKLLAPEAVASLPTRTSSC
jgi:response regulator RpfG family c-di-GMP phosphodiesterase